MQGLFTTPTMLAVQKAVEGRYLRHQAISYNLANVSTPGFKRVEVHFEDALQKALAEVGDSPRPSIAAPASAYAPIHGVQPTLTIDDTPPLRADGSNVDVDQEAVNLAENSSAYLALVEILNRQYEGIRTAIRETVR